MSSRGLHLRASALALSLAALAAPAWAKPRLEVTVAQAREVAEVKDGVRSVRRVPTRAAAPGEVVEYTVSYVNRGDEPARDAVIDDPVPAGTTFLSASAGGAGVELRASADGGKSYAPEGRVTRPVALPGGAVERRPARPEEYTHLRWVVTLLPPGAGGAVTFRVRVN